MTEAYREEIDGGKYTAVVDTEGRVTFLCHGAPWPAAERLRYINVVNHLVWELHEARNPTPIPMILFCPACGVLHVDAPKGEWTNPPHRSHECQSCGCIWRPADVPTTGVATIETKGKWDHMEYRLTHEYAAPAYTYIALTSSPPDPNARVHFDVEPETLGIDGTTRKAHYGEGRQPWDDIKESGWGPEFAAGNVLKYLRRSKQTEDSLKKARWYWKELLKMTSEWDIGTRNSLIMILSDEEKVKLQ